MRPPLRTLRSIGLILGALGLLAGAGPEDQDWVDLSSLDAWKPPIQGWATAGSANLDPADPRKLATEPGSDLIHNGPIGRGRNLISKEEFGDVEVHLEFLLPKGSNSGVKFQAVYEVQIFDSYGSTRKPTGRDSGGVYPRSEEKPKYHQIDDGYAPLANACKPPGEWQVLDATFHAPRFDDKGQKIANARISATLNGQKVQDNLEVPTPTGSAWHDAPKPTGPLLIQADHGPIAFRSIKARRLDSKP
ncbi:3-keto-disaccharide hydrolase [Tundrisphaera lichenicola]|uniref:3-keto-disaccharide hydrolase n=1 Tax=Tundrisphaera lichenicola TaxID=2029860 RepID=UPI003EB8A643